MSLLWSNKFDIEIFTFRTERGRISYQVTFKIKHGISEDDDLLLIARNRVELEAPRIQSRLDTSNLIASTQCHTHFSRRMARKITINFLPEGTDTNCCITKKTRYTVDKISTILFSDIVSENDKEEFITNMSAYNTRGNHGKIYEPFWDAVEKVMELIPGFYVYYRHACW